MDVISSRPRNRTGYSKALIGHQLHVVLAMVAFLEDGTDGGFDARSLRRIIEELCHEVRSFLCGGVDFYGKPFD